MKISIPIKTVRRLFSAEGYLELGMPTHALEELDAIEEPELVEPTVQFLTGEAYKAQERYCEAIPPLQRAAELIPAPYDSIAWASLSDCFRKNGQPELAEAVDVFVNIADDSILFEDDLEEEELDFAPDEDFFDNDDRPPWFDRF